RGGIFGQGREDRGASPVQRRIGRFGAGFFGAGYRMARHELSDPVAQRRTRRGNHVGLGAASVGDQGFRTQQRPQLGQHRGGGAYRHRQKDQVGPRRGLLQGGDLVDQAQPARLGQRGGLASHAQYPADGAG